MQTVAILQRYRTIRKLLVELQQAAAHDVAPSVLMRNARRLGLVHGSQLVATDDELNLVLDLAVHTSERGRRRPIDRCEPPSGDEAASHILATLRSARFSVFAVERRHPEAGLILRDLVAETAIWLVDTHAATSFPLHLTFAGRLCHPDAFWVTCGTMVPVDGDTAQMTIMESLPLVAQTDDALGNDPRFAAAIYKHAIAKSRLTHARIGVRASASVARRGRAALHHRGDDSR